MDFQSIGRTPREASRIHRRSVERAWVALVDRGEAPGAGVRVAIRDSWLRCLGAGIEPVAQRPQLRGQGIALEALREANTELLQASAHTWRALGDIMQETQSILLVTDAEGTMLDVCGSPLVIERGARDLITPGYEWSEQSIGTNAVGTAIALNAPAEVHGAEHFCSLAKIWSCSAAPVRDTLDGALLGVIDVTSFGESHEGHSLALAVTAAHQVEQTLQSRELARSIQLLHWYQRHASRWARHPVLLLDRKGRVLTANDFARALFADCRDCTPLERGRPFLAVSHEPSVADCNAALPARTRAVALEPYGAGRPWEGGLLVLEPMREARAAARPGHRPEPPTAFAGLIGATPAFVALKERAGRMARASTPVLLLGETGVGKELFARAIHRASPVAGGPLVAVNCGTLTRELAASELFGYEPGAFTGAAPKGRAGKFEEADGGTLLLDEVGELPLDVQVGLLRVLQDNVVVRVGGNAERPVRVRVIAATNRDLEAAVANGEFRLDLYYRLKVLSLRIPPLRERLADLVPLVTLFLAQLETAYGFGSKSVEPALLARLAAHSWPGNVRELKGCIESMYVLCDGERLTLADLPEELQPVRQATADRLPAAPGGRIGELERAAIETELAASGGNLSAAARRLGISRSTLYRKLRRYGL